MFVSHNGKFGNKSISKLHSIYSILAIKKFVIYIKNSLKLEELQNFSKWGRARSSNPLGVLLPLMACCPTHAIIWEMLMKEPE